VRPAAPRAHLTADQIARIERVHPLVLELTGKKRRRPASSKFSVYARPRSRS
jgi:hypothetical protein